MITSSQMIKKVYFPRLIIPLASFATALVDFLVALALFLILLIIFRQPLSISFLYSFPLSLVLIFISSFGLAAMLSALSVKYRDFRYIIPFGMQILFFSSQIIYSIRSLELSSIKLLFYCNPLNGALELFYHPMNNIPLYLPGVMLSFVFAILLLVSGILYFKKTEIFFADII
jgi:lipopolysaccharide transport system permease protein